MRVVRMTIKGELKHSHPGQLELVSKRNHIGSDKPQVLRDERKVAQLALNGPEEIRARTFDPMAKLCGASVGSNMPRRAKTSKVIQAHQVNMGQQGLQTIHAPAVAGLMQAFPVIHRIPPQLSLGAEIVWRHPSDKARAPAIVELEPLGVGPNVAGVR